MHTFITDTTQSISSFVNTVRQTLTLDNVSRFNGYVITQIQSQRFTAFTTIVLVNSVSFAIFNKLANFADQKSRKSITENQYLLKHITLATFMGASGLGVNLLLSRLTDNAMSKAALAGLSVAYVILRLVLVKTPPNGNYLPSPPPPSPLKVEDVVNHEVVQDEEKVKGEEKVENKNKHLDTTQSSSSSSSLVSSPNYSPSRSRRSSQRTFLAHSSF